MIELYVVAEEAGSFLYSIRSSGRKVAHGREPSCEALVSTCAAVLEEFAPTVEFRDRPVEVHGVVPMFEGDGVHALGAILEAWCAAAGG